MDALYRDFILEHYKSPRNFGELDPPGPNPYGEPFNKQHPEINVISNVIENGKPIGNLGDGEAVWHADMTYGHLEK